MIAGDTKIVPVLGAAGGQAFNVATVLPIGEGFQGFYAVAYASLLSPAAPGLVSRLGVQQHPIFGWPNPPASLSIVKLEGGGAAGVAAGALVAGEQRVGRR